MTLRWGIAATGRIARSVGGIIAAHPRMTVVAVGSRDAGRARVLADDLGAPRAHGSYQALVQDDAVQAVYVATPHAQHAEVVEAALRAGKAVLCEKPLTHSLADSRRLAAVAAETGTFLMEGMWTRFNPLVQQLVAQVRAGELGEPRSLHASFGFAAPYDPAGRLWHPDLGGGALLDLGVYVVDLARSLLGEPVQVTVEGSCAPSGVDAEAALVLRTAGGAVALLDVSLRSRLPGAALLVGSEGSVELGPSCHAPTRLLLRRGDDEQEHTLDDRNAGFRGELEEVERCLADGLRESPVMPLAETLATMAVLQQAREQVIGGARAG